MKNKLLVERFQKLAGLNESSSGGDIETMLYTLYAYAKDIKQMFPNSKIEQIENGIKVKLPKMYYYNENTDDPYDEEEGYGIFNKFSIEVSENDYYTPSDMKSKNYTDSIKRPKARHKIPNIYVLWVESESGGNVSPTAEHESVGASVIDDDNLKEQMTLYLEEFKPLEK